MFLGVLAAGVMLLASCGGPAPYCTVLRPEKFRATQTIAVAPISINSFGLAKGVVADTSAYLLRTLRDRMRRHFTVVSVDSGAGALDLSGSRIWDDERRELLRRSGAEAVLFSDVRYSSTKTERHVDIHVKVLDLTDFSVIAESGDRGTWNSAWTGGPELEECVRTTIEYVVARLEVHHYHR